MLHKGRNGQRESWARLRPVLAFRHVSLSLKTGLPEITAWGLYVAFASIRNLFVLHLGAANALAAITLAEGLNQFGELLAGAVFTSVVSLLGAAWASGDRKQYDETVRVVWKYSLRIGVAFAVLQAVLAYPMIRLFMEPGEAGSVIRMTLEIMLFFCLGFFFYICNMVFAGTYESVGRLSFAHLNYALEYFVLYVSSMLLLGTVFGIAGVWAAFPATEALTCLVNLCLAWKTCGHFPGQPEDLGFWRDGQQVKES